MLPSTIYPSCSTPFLKFVEGSGSEVFLYNAVLADDEGRHSGNPVLCWRSYHGKASIITLLTTGAIFPSRPTDGFGGGAYARLLKQSSATFCRAGYEPEDGSQITTPISRILPLRASRRGCRGWLSFQSVRKS